MGNKAFIWIAGTAAALLALYSNAPTIAAVIWVGTMILAAVHNLEVKINKILDDLGIHVSQDDLRD